MAAVYALAIVTFARPWSTGVAPDIPRVYWTFSSPLSATLPAYGLVIGIAALLTLVLALTRGRVESIVFAAAAAGFLIAAIAQANAYSYHIYPITTCLLLALVAAIPAQAAQRRNYVACIAIVALSITALGSIRAIWHRSAAGAFGIEAAVLVDLVRERVSPGASFLAVSTHPYPSFPITNYAGRELASDRNSRSFLPAVARLRTGKLDADTNLQAFAEAKARAAIRHDMALKPALVLINRRPVRHAIGALPFDYLAFYLEDPEFARQWEAYKEISVSAEGFAAYCRLEDPRPRA